MKRPNVLWAVASAPLVVLVAMPVIALVSRASTGAVSLAVQKEDTWEAVGVSLRTSGVALLLIVLLGTPLAYLLGRGRFPGLNILRALVSMPAVLPPAAAGVGLLIAFGRQGLLGPVLLQLGVTLPFTAAAVVLAQVFVASPFHVLQASGAFASLDKTVEESAILEGATSWNVFTQIVVPQVRGPLVSGATLAWARALGEFGATILFAGSLQGVTRTMPLEIYLGFEGDLNVSIVLSCMLMALSLIAVFIGRLLQGDSTN